MNAFQPFAPFLNAKQPYTPASRRYRVDAWLDGKWRPVSGKNGKLEDVILHSENSFSCRIRIVDNVRNKQLYEREADDGQAFEWID